jgi:hypothetical protein
VTAGHIYAELIITQIKSTSTDGNGSEIEFVCYYYGRFDDNYDGRLSDHRAEPADFRL